MRPKIIQLKDGQILRGFHSENTIFLALGAIDKIMPGAGIAPAFSRVYAIDKELTEASGFRSVPKGELLHSMDCFGPSMRFLDGAKLRTAARCLDGHIGNELLGQVNRALHDFADKLEDNVRVMPYSKETWTRLTMTHKSSLDADKKAAEKPDLMLEALMEMTAYVNDELNGDVVRLEFRTDDSTVKMSDSIRAEFPKVLGVTFKGTPFKNVGVSEKTVTFLMQKKNGELERLLVPFSAVTSVKRFKQKESPPEKSKTEQIDSPAYSRFRIAVETKAQADRLYASSQRTYSRAKKLTAELPWEFQSRVDEEAKKLNAELRESGH